MTGRSIRKGIRQFAFVAFDKSTGKRLAHGRNAIDALSAADRIAPNMEIDILALGRAGPWIWNEDIRFCEARLLVSTEH